ncbi:MAG: hypothetical protein KTR24_12935 [Saprospiraceae bacterium]|nr:hypothetical protein [Saprospiraceae bacterium]
MKVCFTYLLCLLSVCGLAQEPVNISFGALRARSIGPAVMSGRISTVDGVHREPNLFYIGAANGGVWKTRSGGASFDPIFDDYTQSIGHITIDQAHPDTVWVGTGEPWVRNSVSVGDGIYVTLNGGRTWAKKGLELSERIAKIQIDPNNPSTVYVAAQGPLWNTGGQRGVYKTEDFGDTWQHVLSVDDKTGCADLTMHPENPNILIAAMWDHQRYPDFFRSGGAGSGLYMTTDGGENWRKITTGLPSGELGRMAVEFAPSNGEVVYLTVEAAEGKGLYKSYDGGQSFEFVNGEFGVTVRPFYFSRLTVDPTDENKIYKCGLNLSISEDGGEGFRQVGSGVHSDIHAIWVSKSNSDYVVIGTDGGGYRSLDGGYLFEMFMNLPLSQFYHISVDNDTPFNVYGGLQDNGTWFGPSRGSSGMIRNSDWDITNWGDGFYSFRHPTKKEIVYAESQGGNLVRFNKFDGQRKDIKPLPEEGEPKYRFNWNSPIAISTHQPDRIYFASQFLFRSEDMGDSWDRISPDLTTNDPERQRQRESGGISIDNSTAENNTTIYAVCESPVDENVIWAGTDDGNLQVTQNGGADWQNVVQNIDGLPRGTWCSYVEASPHDAATAFVTFDGHKGGDQDIYVYRTNDYGQSWTSLVGDGIKGYAHVIRQDPEVASLLYAGTEFGLYISLDAGLSWRRFKNNLPATSVRAIDIQEEESTLAIGTHGRGIYFIDNLGPLRQSSSEIKDSILHFYDLPPTVVRLPRMSRPFGGAGNFAGGNPSASAEIAYYMKKRHTFGKMRLEVFDQDGNLVKELPAGKSAGINIVQLPLRLPPPKSAPTKNRMALFGSLMTPALTEGEYTVRITKGKRTFEHQIALKPDENSLYSKEERMLQQKVLKDLYDMTEQLAHVYGALEEMEQQATKLEEPTIKSFGEEVAKYKATLVSLDGDFYVNEGEEAIREEISQLYLGVSTYPGKPSDRQIQKAAMLAEAFSEVKSTYADFESRAKAHNKKLLAEGKKPLVWKTFEQFKKA